MSETAPPSLEKVDPVQAWQPWEPTAADPWSIKWAGHLYRRAAFGASLAELRQAVKQGHTVTLARLLEGEPDAEQRYKLLDRIGEGLGQSNEPFKLRNWWLYLMLNSPHPLREKMTLFWHNHFATSINKVGRTVMMFNQNRLLRRHALGPFKPFLLDISRDVAMLVWLDSNSNIKGRPNENYAREVMELFSLGVGNYTETDIREAARAFTGWHTNEYDFEFNPRLHDDGEKTVLGQTGNWNGDDIVRIVLERPAAARFLCRKLYAFLISETATPPDSLLEPLADFYRKNDYDTAALVRVILRSRHFYSAHAYRQRIKSPVEFVLGLARAVATGSVAPAALTARLDAMGQSLFAPPNVKGWVGGQAWLNNATVLARHNFAQTVAGGHLRLNEVDQRLAEATSDAEVRVLAAEEAAREEGPGRRPAPPANPSTDIAVVVRAQGAKDPEAAVGVLLELLLQGGVSDKVRRRLVTFLREGTPGGANFDARVRDTAHAIMTMPVFQLA